MRYPFTPQISLGTIPIQDIQFGIFSRHELVPILMALQHLYVNYKAVLDHILFLIAEDISAEIDNKRGCTGMCHWENLVLTALRLGCNLNFDQLADLASYHQKFAKCWAFPNGMKSNTSVQPSRTTSAV